MINGSTSPNSLTDIVENIPERSTLCKGEAGQTQGHQLPLMLTCSLAAFHPPASPHILFAFPHLAPPSNRGQEHHSWTSAPSLKSEKMQAVRWGDPDSHTLLNSHIPYSRWLIIKLHSRSILTPRKTGSQWSGWVSKPLWALRNARLIEKLNISTEGVTKRS